MLYQMLQLDTPFEEFNILVPEVDLTAAAMSGYNRGTLGKRSGETALCSNGYFQCE